MRKSNHLKNIRYFGLGGAESILLYCLSGLTILLPTSMWFRIEPLYSLIGLVQRCIPVFVLLIGGIKAFRIRSLPIHRFFFLDLIISIVCMVWCACANPDTMYYTLVMVLPVAIGWLLLAYLLDGSELTRLYTTFVNIMCFISIISVPLWVIAGILDAIPSTATVTYIWGGERIAKSFWNIYYIPRIQMMDIFGINVPKNCAFFTEGTMYGFLLIVAYLFYRNCLNKGGIKKIILIVAIISTLSVSPIIALALNEAMYFVLQKNKNNKLEILRKISIPIFLIIFSALFFTVLLEKSETGSYSVRLDHFMACFRVFAASFPFGIGYSSSDALYSYLNYAQGLSVGIPYLLAQGGLGILVLLVSKFANVMVHSIKQKNVGGIAFCVVFLWISMLTNNVLHPIFWMMLMLVFTSYEKILCTVISR